MMSMLRDVETHMAGLSADRASLGLENARLHSALVAAEEVRVAPLLPSQNHSQIPRMVSPKTLTYGVFDCEFDFFPPSLPLRR